MWLILWDYIRYKPDLGYPPRMDMRAGLAERGAGALDAGASDETHAFQNCPLEKNTNRTDDTSTARFSAHKSVSKKGGFAGISAGFQFFEVERTDQKTKWRKRRDSNPRYPFRYASFQDWSHQPLGHSSSWKFSMRSARSAKGFALLRTILSSLFDSTRRRVEIWNCPWKCARATGTQPSKLHLNLFCGEVVVFLW